MLSEYREPVLFIILKNRSANRSITLSRELPAMVMVLDCVCVCVWGGGGGGGEGEWRKQLSYTTGLDVGHLTVVDIATQCMYITAASKLWRERIIHRKNSGTSWDSNPRPSEY